MGSGRGSIAALSARIKLKNVNDKEQWKITENITKAAAAATKQGRQWRRRAGGIKREINVEKERETEEGKGSQDSLQLEPGKVHRPRTRSRQGAASLDSEKSDTRRGRRREGRQEIEKERRRGGI